MIKEGHIHLDYKENSDPTLDLDADSMEEIVVMVGIILEKVGALFSDDRSSFDIYKDFMLGKIYSLEEGEYM